MELLRAWLVLAAICWPLLAVGIVWFARKDKAYQAAKIADLRRQGLWGAPVAYPPQMVHVDLTVLKPVTGPVLTGSARPVLPDRVQAEPVTIISDPPAITAG